MCDNPDFGSVCGGCSVCANVQTRLRGAPNVACRQAFDLYEAAHRVKIIIAHGDGNCFFHSLARHCGQDCDRHGRCHNVERYRDFVAQQLERSPGLLNNTPTLLENPDPSRRLALVKAYADGVRKPYAWADDAEINAAGIALGMKMRLISFGEGGTDPRSVYTREVGDESSSNGEMSFAFCHNHWMPMAPVTGLVPKACVPRWVPSLASRL